MESNKVPFRGFRGKTKAGAKRHFGIAPSGEEVWEYTLSNIHGLEMKVINYGCTITSVKVPDRDGRLGDVVLGFDSLEGYLQSDQSIGCVVGRFANRIANGHFSIAGKEYQLDRNLAPHHIHGGLKGFGRSVWKAEEIRDENGVGILFNLLSPDGDEGYPGNLHVEIKYFLGHDNSLSFEYFANTDQATIINLSQHSYFNLNGGTRDILEHELMINADHFLPVDETMIPTGEFRQVVETPFDFRIIKKVGRDIGMPDKQLTIGHGYDHCWLINHQAKELSLAALLYDAETGRTMNVYTTEPGVQLYTANYLRGPMPGKNNTALTPQTALCLETQHFPDSPNQPGFPSVVLHPGENYHSKTLLKFSLENFNNNHV